MDNNILFCGSVVKGNFIEEISRRRKDKVVFAGSYNHITQLETKLFEQQYNIIVFDISSFIDDSEFITDYIKRISKAKTCKIIILAAGYTYKSRIINDLIKAGFVNFILSTGLASQHEEYEKCIDGYYEKNGLEEEMLQEQKKETSPENNNKLISIAVCGTMHRIGTTTQCMQIVKYCMSKGYRAAYVEVNSDNYIGMCKEIYSNIETKENYISYNNIDMYTAEQFGLIDNIAEKYDYLIYDYGSITDASFNKISFLEKELKVFVAGAKPNEINAIQPVLQSLVYREAIYIFNFVPEPDKKDLLEMMCNKADYTVFSSYAPDPFDYVASNYEKIIKLEDKAAPETVKKNILHAFKQKVIRNEKK